MTKLLSILLLITFPFIVNGEKLNNYSTHKVKNSKNGLVANLEYRNSSNSINSVTQVESKQTYLRIKFGSGYEKPFFIAIFADHYRDPYYTYHSISRIGMESGLNPTQSSSYFVSGDTSPWINITSMIYADTGARLIFRTAHTYWQNTSKMSAIFEFATAPDEQSIVKTVERESVPPYMHIVMPPNLSTPENIANCKTDSENAISTGQIADNTPWPTYGKKPEIFPFFVFTNINPTQMDSNVVNRELQTLSNFGFNGPYVSYKEVFNRFGFTKNRLHAGLWSLRSNSSYLEPKVEEMRTQAQKDYNKFISDGNIVSEIDYSMLTDEPLGADPVKLNNDPVAAQRFREWLQQQGKTLTELFPEGGGSWDMVKPVLNTQQTQYPALYYYTQKFRTYSLGSFMQIQKEIQHEIYGVQFPVNVNFSDGVIYGANFYRQGVDYFELMETSSLNSIWGSDWANIASTYQCAIFNSELLRGAARRSNAHIGNYVIAYQNRTPWDVKLKAMGAVARGVKTLSNFYYGPTWGGHESSPWYSKPKAWVGNAEITREIGGAEGLLYPAKTMKSNVAILYSSSTDIWCLDKNHAYGFDRMHTWLALNHAQIPTDILSERDIEDGVLDPYKVCYFSGTNLTQKASVKLKEWVNNGGVLVLTAGAGMKNEYNQANSDFENILPAKRAHLEDLQIYLAAGRSLTSLTQKDYVTSGTSTAEVLSVRQRLTPNTSSAIIGRFSNSSPSIVKGAYGNGTIYCYGFLPSLSYIKEALVYRRAIEINVSNPTIPPSDRYVSEEELIGRSYNPWKYPAGIRDMIIKPVKENNVDIPLTCNTPLVDAVLMESPDDGYVIPLSNYTLQPLSTITLELKTSRSISRIESVRQGVINFTKTNSKINFSLPLIDTDIVKIYFEGSTSAVKNTADNKIYIKPNPAKKNFNINLNGELSIYTLHGTMIKEIKDYIKETDINISDYPRGVYIVKVTNQSKDFTCQLIKL